MNLNTNDYSHAAVWRIAAPMIVSSITVPLLGMVDTAVMGHLDSAIYLAAVSVGAMIIHFIFWAFGFLRMSTVGLAAQAYGANDGNELRNLLARGMSTSMLIALVLIVFQVRNMRLEESLPDRILRGGVRHRIVCCEPQNVEEHPPRQ